MQVGQDGDVDAITHDLTTGPGIHASAPSGSSRQRAYTAFFLHAEKGCARCELHEQNPAVLLVL